VSGVLFGHQSIVNVINFDDKYIVSGSGDFAIKVWNTHSLDFVRNLIGHKFGIICLQYRERLVVSASFDRTIRYKLLLICFAFYKRLKFVLLF